MQKSARKRIRLESELTVTVKNERVHGGNRKPSKLLQPFSLTGKKGVTLGVYTEVWPTFKP